MKRATQFMVEDVSCRGGYLWSYLPDFSRRWGEIEARPSMIWIQPPGTPTVGTLFLEAWTATNDEFYYEAARKAGAALIEGQLPCGGWNYVVDFAGEDSLREWYATVGRNAWRLEEFHHYFGNATFDDKTTVSAARFLLKLYLAKKDPEVKVALDRAINFVLESQHPVGAWPQRYPPADMTLGEKTARYSSYLTLNDDVSSENIVFLAECHRAFGDSRLKEAATRGMESFVRLQLPPPRAGWALQYTPDLQPAGARSYEPRAVVTHVTARTIELLVQFYEVTGDPKFLEPIPAAIDWLESCRLPPGSHGQATHPTFIEPGTGEPLYIHREGSNVVNGRYFADGSSDKTVGHYSSFRTIDTRSLRARYEEARQRPSRRPGEEWRWDSLFPKEENPPDSGIVAGPRTGISERPENTDHVARILARLDKRGRWLSPLGTTSHPYQGDGAKERAAGDFSATFVGDNSDTSPFGASRPVEGISIKTYLRNMTVLIAWLRASETANGGKLP
ncbi:MAG: pectate lyase [Nibricoccus sp.]